MICKLIKAQARIPENKENKIENEHELSKLTTAPPKDTAAFDNNNVFNRLNAAGGIKINYWPVNQSYVCRWDVFILNYLSLFDKEPRNIR